MDVKTNKIICPIGDTGVLKLSITNADDQMPIESQVVEFKVCSSNGSDVLISKLVAVKEGTAVIRLSSEDTAKIPKAGSYRWNVRVFTDATMDENGEMVLASENEEVHSPFAFGSALPTFEAKFVP